MWANGIWDKKNNHDVLFDQLKFIAIPKKK